MLVYQRVNLGDFEDVPDFLMRWERNCDGLGWSQDVPGMVRTPTSCWDDPPIS